VNPGIARFDDILPDGRAYWFWLKVVLDDGKTQYHGPLQVGPDVDNSGKYIDLAATFPWAVKRTYSNASISWDFPSGDVIMVVIRRNTNRRLKNRKEISRFQEWRGSYTDTFPDPEADYWYWIEAVQKNGRIVTQGPVKAGSALN
jgi:hypothetical protein